MWSEWLARTLKRSHALEGAAVKRPHAPGDDEESGIDDVRPSTARLSARAQDEEVSSLAADL
jgi:hypothetical protein